MNTFNVLNAYNSVFNFSRKSTNNFQQRWCCGDECKKCTNEYSKIGIA